jgi:hypothetical protein
MPDEKALGRPACKALMVRGSPHDGKRQRTTLREGREGGIGISCQQIK